MLSPRLGMKKIYAGLKFHAGDNICFRATIFNESHVHTAVRVL